MTEHAHIAADGDAVSRNQRQGLRVRRQMAGRIVLADLSVSRRVTIRDMSTTGARVSVGDWPDLPAVFYLLVRAVPGAAPYRLACEKRWMVGPVAGVRFGEVLPDAALLALTGLSAEAHARAC